ncbi:MAG: NAD(P)H-hydrate dehydratase [Oscillospiraceae bacterium]|nr:NAD(P)H-hydrate dehydratase [Oscillospiraceae bacterium]
MELKVLSHSDVLKILPDRDADAHKGNFGKILLLCGSRGYTGAAALAAMGALRCGAGLVYLGVPEGIYTIEAVKLTEAIVFPLPDDDGSLSDLAVDKILQMLPQMDAVLIGPGLGQSDGTLTVLKTVLAKFTGPVVIDADGINLLAGHIDLLRGRAASTILTPHEGEFSRIAGQACKDRVAEARAFAADNQVILLLKGHRTVITDGATCYINQTGNPGMAVGGSGDVLAGMITALLGQGVAPLQAAACGAWLHGAAGDICEKEIGQYGMLPTDMLQVLPRLLK